MEAAWTLYSLHPDPSVPVWVQPSLCPSQTQAQVQVQVQVQVGHSPGCKHVPGFCHHVVQRPEQSLTVADQRGTFLILTERDGGLPQVESVFWGEPGRVEGWVLKATCGEDAS